MYHAVTDFLRSFSAEHRVLWALLILGAVTATSLGLFGFWELVLRFLSPVFSRKKNNTGRMD